MGTTLAKSASWLSRDDNVFQNRTAAANTPVDTSFVATYRGSFCRGQSPSASIILTLRSPRYDLSAGGAYVHVPHSLNKWRSIIWHTPRSEERREGKEWVGTCRYRWSTYHKKKTK